MFERGPGHGFGAWAKEETLRRFPNAVCRRENRAGIQCFTVYADKSESRVLAIDASARGAWSKASDKEPADD